MDVYHYGECNRISPEAPVPIFTENRVEFRHGMAMNVFFNLRSFGLNAEYITDNTERQKHRYIEEKFKQHVLRVDTNESEFVEEFKFDHRILSDVDLIVLSDYNKGFLSNTQCDSLSKYCFANNIPVFVDSKKTDLSCFENCIIKINEKEYEKVTKYPKNYDLIVTLGEGGTLYKNKIYETKQVEVFDVCGAGDVFIAALVYKYLKNSDIIKSIKFANKCASFSVTKFGTYILTEKDIDGLCV